MFHCVLGLLPYRLILILKLSLFRRISSGRQERTGSLKDRTSYSQVANWTAPAATAGNKQRWARCTSRRSQRQIQPCLSTILPSSSVLLYNWLATMVHQLQRCAPSHRQLSTGMAMAILKDRLPESSNTSLSRTHTRIAHSLRHLCRAAQHLPCFSRFHRGTLPGEAEESVKTVEGTLTMFLIQ